MRRHTGAVRTHVRECTLKVDSGKKIPPRTGESNLRQRRAGPTLYELSYIRTPVSSLAFSEWFAMKKGQHYVTEVQAPRHEPDLSCSTLGKTNSNQHSSMRMPQGATQLLLFFLKQTNKQKQQHVREHSATVVSTG